MNRLVTVTLNPAIDRTVEVAAPLAGTVRCPPARVLPGGKGVNVARAARSLGIHVATTGVAGGHSGRWLVESLEREGLSPDFVLGGPELRVTVTLYGGQLPETIIVEDAQPQRPELFETLGERITTRHADAALLVVAGSVPAGMPADACARLTRAARAAGVPVLVDTAGPQLRHALSEEPDVVKVTVDEARAALNADDDASPADLVRTLIARGAGSAVVTAGSTGAVAGDGTMVVMATPPRIASPRAIGSGDAFSAGLVAQRMAGAALGDALRTATAAGAANAMTTAAGLIDLRTVIELERQIGVQHVTH